MMIMDSLSAFEKNNTILKKTLDSSMTRWNVLANNIANANTPGFKRSDVTFAAEMKRALDSEKLQRENIPNIKTNSKHFDFDPIIDYRLVEPKIKTEYYTTANNNDNNVDMAFETGESLKTSLLYSAASSILQRNFSIIQEMIK